LWALCPPALRWIISRFAKIGAGSEIDDCDQARLDDRRGEFAAIGEVTSMQTTPAKCRPTSARQVIVGREPISRTRQRFRRMRSGASGRPVTKIDCDMRAFSPYSIDLTQRDAGAGSSARIGRTGAATCRGGRNRNKPAAAAFFGEFA